MDRDTYTRIGVLVLAVQMLERRVQMLEGLTPVYPRVAPVTAGRGVAAHLAARGWTQKVLAERAGLHPVNVNRWLSGAHRMPVAAAVAMARALGVSVEELWG